MDSEKKDKVCKMESGEEERVTWAGRLDFTMSALSFAVGMGNLWRFPYLCYRNGGGAFLLPYLTMMLLCGYPLMFLELALGQYARQGIVNVWKAVPLFQGIGWGMFCVSLFTCIYYNMLIAWCFFYLFASFAKDVPWRDCDNSWNTKDCSTLESTFLRSNCTQNNGTWLNNTCIANTVLQAANVSLSPDQLIKRTSASEEFFQNYMLDLSPGLDHIGGIRWELALCLLLCWTLIFISLAKGITVSGKVTYITAMFPYVILIILFIRGLTLDGAYAGILYYVTPEWDKLLSAKVWGDAAMQAFFSLSLCWGGMLTLASYNNFHNNCLRDTIVVATGDMLTSVFGGFVIFAIIGYMAHILGVPVGDVVAQGPGLAFIVYPEVVAKLPLSPLWAALFMIMLINVGMGTQMGTVSTLQTTLVDMFPKFKEGRRPLLVLLVICVVAYICGLILTTQGGAYLLLLMDNYSATYTLLVLALFECIAIGWVYGVERFMKDIEQMIGHKPSVGWVLCLKYLTPAVVIFLIVSVIMDFKRSSYGDYIFPIEWDVIGAFITIISISCVPVFAVYNVVKSDKASLIEKIRHACQPTTDWTQQEEDNIAASKLLINASAKPHENTEANNAVELQPLTIA